MSPHIPFRALSLADNDSARHASRPSSAMGSRGAVQNAPARSYPSIPGSGYSSQSSMHPRGVPADPTQARGGSSYYPSGVQQPYPQPYAQQANMRMDPRALGSGTYPYAPSQSQMGQIPISSSSGGLRTGADNASSRYECSYCSKGFTRPSSLKVMSHLINLMKRLLMDSVRSILIRTLERNVSLLFISKPTNTILKVFFSVCMSVRRVRPKLQRAEQYA